MNISNSIDFGGLVRDWFVSATERRELLALEDRMLRDVGLTHADVGYLVRHPVEPQAPHVLVRPSDVDPETIRAYVDRAHALRAQAFGSMGRAIWHWLRT